MSFRGRLTLFFLLIVVLPMIAVGVLVTQIVTESTNGKADARLSEGLDSALTVYRDDVAAAHDAAKAVARDPRVSAALRSGQRAGQVALAEDLIGEHGIRAIAVDSAHGEGGSAGPKVLVAPYRLNLNLAGGSIGSLTVSTTTPSAYLANVHHLTGRDGALLTGGRVVSSTVDVAAPDFPAAGRSADVSVGDEKQRAATTALPPPGRLELALFSPRESGGFFSSSPLVIAALVVFFAIALLFVLTLLRMLGGQVRSMLGAARRIGEGDFSQKVPVTGRDEMAGLASEFNKMSGRLSEQMEELRRQKVEIDRSVRRIGQAFASGLDRQALLKVVVEAALGACGATYGTIALRGTEDGADVTAGAASEAIQDLAVTAEGDATREDGLVARHRDRIHALAAPLRRIGESPETVGVMTVAREGEQFTAGEKDIFVYLIGQVASSIENIALHELVSEQAVTDGLTGLSNQRRFSEFMAKEEERAHRFGHDLSLIMLDIDDFKQVNDEHGHLQGDEVLRTIGRILDEESRGIDEPARYGGEEFAVALPETGVDGAVELAERIRARIESERVPGVNGAAPLRVTASVGAASMPASAAKVQDLIAAADGALYQAKRSGKNRVVSASATSQAGRS